MSDCDFNCDACDLDCDKRDFLEPCNINSSVKRVIGVVSGKGGVGKSSITSLLAVLKMRENQRVAILDGDITGPSIPKLFGMEGVQIFSDGTELYPAQTKNFIKIMSTNLLLENSDDPVIWRGPVLAGAIKQYWTDVHWGNIDYMFVDMPPGTGDVPLTIFQSFPLNGIIIVTSPQELVGMIVGKAVNMAKQMNIPILGIVENMSYAVCPDCGRKLNIFGESHVEEVAKEYGLKVLAKLPIDSTFTDVCDKGLIEDFNSDWLDDFSQAVENI